MTTYLDGEPPRVFAHRGLCRTTDGKHLDENTIAAFEAAIAAGADYIETDLQLTRDDVAVVFHDADLVRVAGVSKRVSELTKDELDTVYLLNGGQVPTLSQVLNHFPTARFNIDFKSKAVILPAAEAIREAKAENRVLVASFSDRRRRIALSLLPGAVSSAGASRLLWLYLAWRLRFNWWQRQLAKDVVALQIPESAGPFRFANHSFITAMSNLGLEVHFWTVNEPSRMQELVALGAAGIVTDRADLASVLRV